MKCPHCPDLTGKKKNILERLEIGSYGALQGVHLCSVSVESAFQYISDRWSGTLYKKQRAQKLHRLCKKALKECKDPQGLKALTVHGSFLLGLNLNIYDGPKYHILTDVEECWCAWSAKEIGS